MNKPFANKWVRKAIYDAIENIVVIDQVSNDVHILQDGNTNSIVNSNGIEIASADFINVPCYDTNVTANGNTPYYNLLTTQTNVEEHPSKCEAMWRSSILIDTVTIFSASGNMGSRLLVDNITDAIITATRNITLDVESGLRIHKQTIGSINNLDNQTDTQNVFRNLLRLELEIY
jgi:hypothetical protein